jgi:hypothetical protein
MRLVLLPRPLVADVLMPLGQENNADTRSMAAAPAQSLGIPS